MYVCMRLCVRVINMCGFVFALCVYVCTYVCVCACVRACVQVGVGVCVFWSLTTNQSCVHLPTTGGDAEGRHVFGHAWTVQCRAEGVASSTSLGPALSPPH